MGSQVDIDTVRALSTENMDKFRVFEREVIGGITREIEGRKEKKVQARMTREKKAKRKRQRAASMA
jgi:hypothetical protein